MMSSPITRMIMVACVLCVPSLADGADFHPKALPFTPLDVESRTLDGQPAEFGAFHLSSDRHKLYMIDIGILKIVAVEGGQVFVGGKDVAKREADGWTVDLTACSHIGTGDVKIEERGGKKVVSVSWPGHVIAFTLPPQTETPVPAPKPAEKPKPVAQPTPVVRPTPVARPTPVVRPTPLVKPQPAPVVARVPEPKPEPVVAPKPVPRLEPFTRRTSKRDLRVPQDYPTIQGAINASRHGSTVVVSPGRYREHIDFKARAITVRSTDPTDPNVVASTILDGAGEDGSVVKFESHEMDDSVLQGFTITNGSCGLGGAVACKEASPTIRECVFVGNLGHHCGGAIDCDRASPWIVNNVFYRNQSGFGGAIDLSESKAVISHNTFSDNSARHGGAIYCRQSSPTIEHCIFAHSKLGGAVKCDRHSKPAMAYCAVFGNTGGGLFRVDQFGDSAPMSCAGAVNADPLFADRSGGDLHLKSKAGRRTATGWTKDSVHSPCIDAGNPKAEVGGEPAPNGRRVNIGAYGGTAQAAKSAR